MDRPFGEARIRRGEQRALAERVRVRELHADAGAGAARHGVMLAVDDVAYPPDAESEGDPRGSRVGGRADRDVAPAQRDDEPAQDAADRRAPHRDPTGPDREDLLEVLRVVVPAISDVEEARARDPADHAPGRDG